MHGSAPWKTEETIVGLPRLLRSDSPDLVAVTFHLSVGLPRLLRSDSPDLVAVTFHLSQILQIWWLSHFTFPRFSRFGGCHISPFRSFPAKPFVPREAVRSPRSPQVRSDTRFGSGKIAVGEYEILQSRGRVTGKSR